MKKISLLYITVLMGIGFVKVQAQENADLPVDSVKLLKSSQQRNSAQFRFNNATFLNPAIYYHTFDFSNSEFSLGYDKKEQDEAVVEQTGNGKKGYGLNVSTFLSPGGKYRTWGRAQYLNQKIQGQYKNLTSDYERLYPYISGDTLPAKDISSETYYLGGGYAQDQGKYTWGISASSRNLQEYRQIDPRPRNRVSDVNIAAGLAWKLPKQYTVGLSAEYNTYKQAQTISFLSDERRKIGSSLYHYSGLGNSSYNTGTDIPAFSYEGQRYGTTLSLYPVSGNGIFANLKYLYDDMDKNLAGASTLHTIMNMGEDQYDAQIGWLGNQQNYSWAVKGNYNRRHRIGSEIIMAKAAEEFNDASGIYHYGLSPYYKENIDRLQLQLYFEKIGKLCWFIMPEASYNKSNTEHIYPYRSRNWERMKYGLSAGLSFIKRKHLFMLNIQGNYDQHLSSHQDISSRLENISSNGIEAYEIFLRHSTATEQANYRFISTDNKHIGASARWEWQLFKNKSLFASPQYQKGWYTENIESQYFEISVGLVL